MLEVDRFQARMEFHPAYRRVQHLDQPPQLGQLALVVDLLRQLDRLSEKLLGAVLLVTPEGVGSGGQGLAQLQMAAEEVVLVVGA